MKKIQVSTVQKLVRVTSKECIYREFNPQSTVTATQ